MICLLVETVDKRKFLTSKKNLKALSEFYQRFGATIRLVDANCRGKLLSLERLAEVLCDPHSKPESFAYEIVCSEPYLQPKQQKLAIDRLAESIEKDLRSGKKIDVAKFAANKKTPVSSVRRCINKVKARLAAEGKMLSTVKPGVYCL